MTELSATSAEPGYVNRLALKHLPFSNVMPNSAFYDGSHIKQRRLLLQHLLRATRRPIVLQAASGAGKTTLVSQLQRSVGADLRFCSFGLANERSQFLQVFSQLGAEAQVSGSDADLKLYLSQLRRLNIIPVLIVDELESLTEPARQQLSDWLGWLDEEQQPLWQAVVCSKNTERLAEIDFQIIDVPLLELSDIAPYLQQRLSAAGYQDELPFTDKTIRRFYRLSAGNPAKLNQLAHQQLLEPVKQRQWSLTLPRSVQHVGRWFAAILVALAIILVLVYQQAINQWIESQSAQQEEVLSLPEVYEPAEVVTVVADEVGEDPSDSRQELADLLADIPTPDEVEDTDRNMELEIRATEVPPDTDLGSADKPEELVAQQIMSNEQSAEAELDVDTAYASDWILQQKADTYTFQLMGSWETAEVDEFIEKNALSGDYARFTSLRDGKPWHVLIYGVYPSKKAALKASNQWPAPMNTLPTWLRRFDSVQAQIKEKGVTP